jgi:syndecan 4
VTCSVKKCPKLCSLNGLCQDGNCICQNGFKGKDCSERECPNKCSGRGLCVNGLCMCRLGFGGNLFKI